jgi:hypothetical protein
MQERALECFSHLCTLSQLRLVHQRRSTPALDNAIDEGRLLGPFPDEGGAAESVRFYCGIQKLFSDGYPSAAR